MFFTDIFIRKPVLATVLSLVLLLVGLRSYFGLQVRLYPKIDASVVSISTSYAGADASLMEGFVTTPIENALGGIDGIDYITSSSTTGSSTVTIYFHLGYDINVAISDVNAKVNAVRSVLPREIDDPVISKNDPNSSPSLYLSFASSVLSQEAVVDYLTRVVQPQFQTLSGVGKAAVLGPTYAMRIWLDHRLMAAHGVTPADIGMALKTQSLQAPGGRLKSAFQEVTVKTFSEATTAQQFNHLILRQDDGKLVKLQDVGKAELGSRYADLSVWINSQDSAVVAITPASTANPLNVTQEVLKLFPTLLKTLPKTIQASITWDNSKFIAESIKEVQKTLLEATICVILVVFLFLGSWRTLIVPIVAIPLSLIGVCIFMYLLGYSLNTITFLSMVLAIGMVVDDAIVVTENIHRHIALGKSPLDAALIGAREIQFAVIAMTFTLAAVYAPIGFLTGLVGALFKEFAFTLAGAVIISGFIALTLSPMMCSKIMPSAEHGESVLAHRINLLSERLSAWYARRLQATFRYRWLILAVVPTVLIGMGVLYQYLPRELAPKEDQGVVVIPIIAPTSANINYLKQYSKKIEGLLINTPERENCLVISGSSFSKVSPNSGVALLTLKPWSERTRSVDQIIMELFPQIWSIPGITAFPINPSSLPGAGYGDPVELQLQTLGDYRQLHALAHKIAQLARMNPRLYNIRVEPKLDLPQLGIYVDREKAGSLGVKISDIGGAINLALGQPTAGHFSIEGRGYDVVPQLLPELSEAPDTLDNIYLRTASSDLVSLRNIVTTQESVVPESYDHFQQLRAMTISAGITPGYTLGEALDFFEKLIQKEASDQVMVNYSGQSRLYLQTGSQMAWTFGFAVIFIFLVLAAQFESFRDPFVVLFTIPLSIFGAMVVMWLTRSTMNIYSEIGLVTLIGLISKHGILMVEFANQLQVEGRNLREAITEAAAIRLRPILMTTAAMVLGAVPLVLAHGAGAASRHQIGWVIVGGMLIGTLFTLFVLPTIYIHLAAKRQVA